MHLVSIYFSVLCVQYAVHKMMNHKTFPVVISSKESYLGRTVMKLGGGVICIAKQNKPFADSKLYCCRGEVIAGSSSPEVAVT